MAIIEAGRGREDCEQEVLGLKKRLESLPVIEQAKGILIAAEGCTPDGAFEMLKRASQRENLKLRDIAARIVEHAVDRRKGSIPYRPGRLSSPPQDG